MNKRLIAGLSLMLSSMVLAGTDFTTPQEAYRTYTQALMNCDAAGAKGAVLGSDAINKFIDSQIEYNQIESKFRNTVIKNFPETAKELVDPNEDILKKIEKATVKITGDTAIMTTADLQVATVNFKRVDGKWKIDLEAMFQGVALDQVIKYRSAVGEIMQLLTPDIEVGKFKNYDELKASLQMRVQVRMASMADDEPTTKPSK